MSTTTFVRKFVFGLADGTTFATRELLNSGPRGSVDKALARLVNASIIIRVARGVFVKPLYDSAGEPILPTLAEIVRIKAEAFGKQLLTHGRDAANAFKFFAPGMNTEIEPNRMPTFTTSGSSTSFLCKSRDFGFARVQFRSSSPLSKKFVDAAAGLFFRAMRSSKDNRNNHSNFAKAHETFNKQQRVTVKAAAMWMPAWLSDLFWTA